MILLATAGIIHYMQVQARISADYSALEEDVRATHLLLRKATELLDYELFSSLVNDVDERWLSVQEQLFDHGWTLDQPWIGMFHPDSTADVLEISVARDRKSATVLNQERYSICSFRGRLPRFVSSVRILTAGIGVGVCLRQMKIIGEKMAGLQHPASEISADLDNALNRLCGVEKTVKCPSDFQLKVKFSQDLGSLLSAAEHFVDSGPIAAAEKEADEAPALVLPTPSLFGLPADDTSYQAMLEGYGVHVAAAI